MQPRFIVNHRRAGDIERLPEAVRRVARLCDGMRTIDDLAALTRLPAERAGQVVERLANLGIVFAVTEPPLKSIRRRRVTPLTVQQWLSTPPAGAAPVEATAEPAPAEAVPAAPVHVSAEAPVVERAIVVVEPQPPALEPPPLEAPRVSLTLPPPPAPPLDAFEADEESFFASPIDHLVGDDFFE